MAGIETGKLERAVGIHETGDLTTAERMYREILEAEPEHAAALHMLGVAAIQRSDPHQALELMDRAVRIDASDPLLHCNRGAACRSLGDGPKAMASFRRALDVDPTFAEAHYNLGLVLADMGDLPAAEQALQQAVELRPDFWDAWSNLGIVQSARGKQVQAIQSFVQVVRARPDSFEAHYNLGNAACSVGRYAEAVGCYQQALRINAEVPELFNNLGTALQELGEQRGAIASFQRSLELRPDGVDACRNLAGVLLQAVAADDTDRQTLLPTALTALEETLRHAPDNVELHCLRGRALQLASRQDEAVECLRKALRIAPDHAPAHFDLADLLVALRQTSAAQVHYRRGLEIDSSHVHGWNRLGLLESDLGNSEAARECFERVVELRPNVAESHFNLGNACRDLDRPDEARAAYETALQLRPEFAAAHNNLGMICYQCGQLDEAAGHFARVRELDPQHTQALNNLGNVWHRQGRVDDAVACYEQVLAQQPGQIQAVFNLAQARKDQRRLDEAVAGFEQVLQLDPRHHRAVLELANTYRHAGKLDLARQYFENYLSLRPDDLPAHVSFGNVLKELDELELAREHYQVALQHLPDQPQWKLWAATLCPVVMKSVEEISAYRARLSSELVALADQRVQMPLAAMAKSACPPPYQLQFHGADNLPLKRQYAEVFAHLVPETELPRRTSRPRVGMVVTDGHEGVFVRFLGSVLRRMSLEEFDLTIICSPAGKTKLMQRLAVETVDYLPIPPAIDRASEAILAGEFDLLYYWEVGSDVTNYFLAMMRLAPVQCTSWGLPETTGLPNMDVFLSNAEMEPPGAAAHYSERLVLLPSFLSYRDRWQQAPAEIDPGKFGLPEGRNLYVSAHKLAKFHPDFDAILSGILHRDPAGLVVIPEDERGFAARHLRSRLDARLGPVADRVAFVPYLPLDDYLGLTSLADVLLDPLYYGGGLTAVDGLALNKAAVTLPGEFLRGRFAWGFCKRIGLSQCIASSMDDYIDIATAIGTDRDYRQHLEEELTRSTPALFEDEQAVRDYEEVFRQLIEESRAA